MKLGTVVLAIVLVTSALAGVVWVGKYGNSPLPLAAAAANSDEANPGEPLPISKTGPYPKVVLEETEHDFGVMAVGEERKHKFVVRNEGEAPLKLKRGVSTCKCTLSDLAKEEIAPGESAEIELAWTPKVSDEEFRQTATVWTNDPEKKQLELVVHGRVEELLVIRPYLHWDLGMISEGAPTTITGTVHSVILDKFAITGFETSSPLLSAEATPLSADELQELDPAAKCGYRVQAMLEPQMPVGRFRESVTVKTDAKGDNDFPLQIYGSRPGPLQFVKMPGYDWYPEDLAMSFGRFKASEGKKGTILLIVQGMEGQSFEFTDVQADPDFLKLSLEPNDPNNTGARQSYRLTVEVPPGSPPLSRVRKAIGAGAFQIKTNHPQAPEIKLFAEFISY